MTSRTTAYGSVILATGVVLSAAFNAYLIRTDVGGTALWNAREAYFFIGLDTVGRHVKWIQYPFLVAGEVLGDIEPPDDGLVSLFVLRVTPDGVERHILKHRDRRPGSGPGMFTPLEGRIWLNYPSIGGLCWWAGDHFERATPEELKKLGGLSSLDNQSYVDKNGWSKSGVWNGHIGWMKMGNGVELLAGGTSPRDSLTIEMRKPGREPTTIFSLSVSAGLVSGSEYRRAFRDDPK